MNPVCPQCQQPNRPSAAYCAHCGQKMAGASGIPVAASSSQRYLAQARQLWTYSWRQAKAEFAGWYHDIILRRPEVEGEILSAPTTLTVSKTTQVFVLFTPATSQTTQLAGLSFQVASVGGGSGHSVLMIGPRQGDSLQAGDRVRIWGVWDVDAGYLRAWRVEVSERAGRSASYVATTGRQLPLAALSIAIVGFLLFSFLCGLFSR